MKYKTLERKSVCVVSQKDINGQKWLERIADIEDEELIVLHPENGVRGSDDEKEKLLKKNGPDNTGYVGVWSYSSIYIENNGSKSGENLQTKFSSVTKFCVETQIVFMILYNHVSDINDIVEIIKSGIYTNSCCSRILVGFLKDDNYYVLYLDQTNCEIINGKWILKDRTATLESYCIPKTEIIEHPDVEYGIYRYLELPFPENIISILDPFEVIQQEITSRFSWSVVRLLGMSESHWKLVRDFLSEIRAFDFYEIIAKRCQISFEEAEEYVDEFMDSVDDYIDGDAVDIEIIKSVVENSEEMLDRYEHNIENKWRKSNTALIENAKNELSDLETKISQEKEILEKIQADIEKLKSEQKSINHFKDVQNINTNNTDIYFEPGMKIKNYIEEDFYYWEDVIDHLSDMLIVSGMNKEYSSAFAVFMYASYINKVPLLFAGPNSGALCDAFSVTMYGKLASRINCQGECRLDLKSYLNTTEEEFIVIDNATYANWMDMVIKSIEGTNKFICLTTPFADSLSLESKELLNYVIPVFTELIIDNKPGLIYSTRNFSYDFEEYDHFSQADISVLREFKKYKMPRLLKNNLQSVLSDMKNMDDRTIKNNPYLFFMYPIAYFLNKSDQLLEILEDKKIIDDKKIINRIKDYIED